MVPVLQTRDHGKQTGWEMLDRCDHTAGIQGIFLSVSHPLVVYISTHHPIIGSHTLQSVKAVAEVTKSWHNVAGEQSVMVRLSVYMVHTSSHLGPGQRML